MLLLEVIWAMFLSFVPLPIFCIYFTVFFIHYFKVKKFIHTNQCFRFKILFFPWFLLLFYSSLFFFQFHLCPLWLLLLLKYFRNFYLCPDKATLRLIIRESPPVSSFQKTFNHSWVITCSNVGFKSSPFVVELLWFEIEIDVDVMREL